MIMSELTYAWNQKMQKAAVYSRSNSGSVNNFNDPLVIAVVHGNIGEVLWFIHEYEKEMVRI